METVGCFVQTDSQFPTFLHVGYPRLRSVTRSRGLRCAMHALHGCWFACQVLYQAANVASDHADDVRAWDTGDSVARATGPPGPFALNCLVDEEAHANMGSATYVLGAASRYVRAAGMVPVDGVGGVPGERQDHTRTFRVRHLPAPRC
jgi:hypothetical protein